MNTITKEEALRYHRFPQPGKIETVASKPTDSPRDLSLAYSPGVAWPCLEIAADKEAEYLYTNKANLVAVISNGTAVLGLGDIGAAAAKPVMEGKALLFKIFAGLDCYDIEIDETDPKTFVASVKAMSSTFGGINLEDIKAPECFEIERELKSQCDIPVMHDDQHGTAIVSGAALINALEIQSKDIAKVKVVINGAGAAAISCARLWIRLGVTPANIVMCDSKGVIHRLRQGLNDQKKEFATDKDVHTLAEAMRGADVFLGLSVADVVTAEMLQSMADKPVVFALANPNPEIDYESAMRARQDLIFATGRSDYPNQINNVLGFPYIFRAALDCRASEINEEMKVAAARAIAALAHKPVPKILANAYGKREITFGAEYILPKPFDKRLLEAVAPEIAIAAHESGVARRPIRDMSSYRLHLNTLISDNEAYIVKLLDPEGAHCDCGEHA